ncbi:MAG: hypothetical protein NTY68_05565 [Candidatus Micrarchaeota archaeon]|nr:hypothetical protein [Candidatus Micrarchaeota archaeon]
MITQKEMGALQENPKGENLSKFKGALKNIKSGIRNITMPFALSSLIMIFPGFKHQEVYAQDSASMIAQIKKDNPKINDEPALLYFKYLNQPGVKQKAKEGIRKMIEGVNVLIEKNKENRIFCITLNSVMKEIIDNPNSDDYFIRVNDSKLAVGDRVKDPTKMIILTVSGKNGVKVSIFNLDAGSGDETEITSKSTSKDVDKLRLEMSRFFGTLLPGIILINTELEENRKK